MAVHHDNSHSATGQQRARHLYLCEMLALPVDQSDQQHGEKGTGADDERGVGGCGIEHRRILCQEIQ